tara:strand:+ start:35510 stop:36070 length:561 start_codon:yes stop_codon:yes gene_type:complete
MHRKSTKNLFLALAIGLPLILVAILWFAVQLRQSQLAAPSYNFIYTIRSYATVSAFQLSIENNGLYLLPKANRRTVSFPEVYIYDVNNNTSMSIDYQKPNLQSEKSKRIKIYEFKNASIRTSGTSPDGYRYQYYARSHGFIFFHNNRQNKPELVKKGKRFELTIPDLEKKSFTILGWIIPENQYER